MTRACALAIPCSAVLLLGGTATIQVVWCVCAVGAVFGCLRKTHASEKCKIFSMRPQRAIGVRAARVVELKPC